MDKEALKNMFAGFNDCEPGAGSGGPPKIKADGTYTVEVGTVKLKPSERYNATYFIVEFKILKTSNERIYRDSVYSWSHNALEKHYGMANIKMFLASVLGFKPQSPEGMAVSHDDLHEAVSHEQPLRGLVVQLTTSHKETEKGYDFWIHEWAPVADLKEVNG